MPGTKIIALAFLGLLAGIGLLYLGLRSLKGVRLVLRLRTSHIRFLKPGLAEVAGEVKAADSILKSPLASKNCVYYAYTVEAFDKKSEEWNIVSEGTETLPFYVDDGTGKVFVDPEGADIAAETSLYYDSRSRKPLPPEIEKSLAKLDVETENRKFSFSEEAIVVGERIFVVGTASEEGRRDMFGRRLMKIAKGKGWFYISDSPEKTVLADFGKAALFGIACGIALIIASIFAIVSILNSFP